jgi:hypothetical protein
LRGPQAAIPQCHLTRSRCKFVEILDALICFACSDCLAVLEKGGPGPTSICDPKPEFQERQATILAVPLSPILSFPTRQRTPPTSFLTVRARGDVRRLCTPDCKCALARDRRNSNRANHSATSVRWTNRMRQSCIHGRLIFPILRWAWISSQDGERDRPS